VQEAIAGRGNLRLRTERFREAETGPVRAAQGRGKPSRAPDFLFEAKRPGLSGRNLPLPDISSQVSNPNGETAMRYNHLESPRRPKDQFAHWIAGAWLAALLFGCGGGGQSDPSTAASPSSASAPATASSPTSASAPSAASSPTTTAGGTKDLAPQCVKFTPGVNGAEGTATNVCSIPITLTWCTLYPDPSLSQSFVCHADSDPASPTGYNYSVGLLSSMQPGDTETIYGSYAGTYTQSIWFAACDVTTDFPTITGFTTSTIGPSSQSTETCVAGFED
jgi:hypothetical protein